MSGRYGVGLDAPRRSASWLLLFPPVKHTSKTITDYDLTRLSPSYTGHKFEYVNFRVFGTKFIVMGSRCAERARLMAQMGCWHDPVIFNKDTLICPPLNCLLRFCWRAGTYKSHNNSKRLTLQVFIYLLQPKNNEAMYLVMFHIYLHESWQKISWKVFLPSKEFDKWFQ